MRSRSKLLAAFVTSTVWLAGCEMKPKEKTISDTIKEVGKWNIPSDQKAKYSHLPTNEARTLFVRDTYMNRVGVMESEPERLRLAAAIYLNYYMLQGKAIPNYCKGMNVDISGFQAAFDRNNYGTHAGVGKILAIEGTSFDEIYTQFVPKYKTAAKYELMSTGSSYSACQTIKEKTAQLANMSTFSKFYPDIARTLRSVN